MCTVGTLKLAILVVMFLKVHVGTHKGGKPWCFHGLLKIILNRSQSDLVVWCPQHSYSKSTLLVNSTFGIHFLHQHHICLFLLVI
jgi:hypothetical protein